MSVDKANVPASWHHPEANLPCKISVLKNDGGYDGVIRGSKNGRGNTDL